MLERFTVARVLIVDEDSAGVALLRGGLIRAGFKFVFTETDPRRVLAGLPDVDPDVIILALHMAQLDGLAVLQQIRQFAPGEYLPVLIVSVDITEAAAEGALRGGAQDCVSKPFNEAEVLLRVQNLLETRFMYTTLRSSTVLAREGTREGRRLTRALLVEQDTVERLEDLDDLKDTLLQTVSHDLRNPISAVRWLTGLLAADARGTQPLTVEKKLEIIDKVEFTAEKMGDLLRDLLDSDPMQKNAELYPFYDVGELVERVLAGVDLARNHPVETDLGSVTTNIDPAHVERMVENLLTNAARHVPPGVPVWVKTAGSAAGGVLISVEDAGPGIVPEIAARIFQPSRRGTHNGSERLSLGLSLVSRFAQLHGGKAWLEERPGGGSAFRIFLPPPTPTPPDTDLGTTFPGTPLETTNGERHHRPR